MIKKSIKVLLFSLIVIFIFSTFVNATVLYDKLKTDYDKRYSLTIDKLYDLKVELENASNSNDLTQNEKEKIKDYKNTVKEMYENRIKNFIPDEFNEYVFIYKNERDRIRSYSLTVCKNAVSALESLISVPGQSGAYYAYKNALDSAIPSTYDEYIWVYNNANSRINSFSYEVLKKAVETLKSLEFVPDKKAIYERYSAVYEPLHRQHEEQEQAEVQRTAGDFTNYLEDYKNKGNQHIDLSGASSFTAKVGPILGFIRNIGAIISVIAISVVGIKYMIGSVEQRAEYKKNLIPFVFGLVFFTGIVTIVNFILRVTSNMAQ